MMGDSRTWITLLFHSPHQWFLSRQPLRQKSAIWPFHWLSPQPHRPQRAPVHGEPNRGEVRPVVPNIRGGTWSLTLHKAVNPCLSSRGLPLAAGYSQSRSRPSNPCFLSTLMEDWMNVFLLACVETIVVNLESRRKRGVSRDVHGRKTHILLRNVLLGCSKSPTSDCQQCF